MTRTGGTYEGGVETILGPDAKWRAHANVVVFGNAQNISTRPMPSESAALEAMEKALAALCSLRDILVFT